jgi:hypothetical protein
MLFARAEARRVYAPSHAGLAGGGLVSSHFQPAEQRSRGEYLDHEPGQHGKPESAAPNLRD